MFKTAKTYQGVKMGIELDRFRVAEDGKGSARKPVDPLLAGDLSDGLIDPLQQKAKPAKTAETEAEPEVEAPAVEEVGTEVKGAGGSPPSDNPSDAPPPPSGGSEGGGGPGASGSPETATATPDGVVEPSIEEPPPIEAAPAAVVTTPTVETPATDAPAADLPVMTGTPFGASDLALPKLDTSGFKRARKAQKATEQYSQVQTAVTARLSELIGRVSAEVSQLQSQLSQERDAHMAALQSEQGALGSALVDARAILTTEGQSARDRLTGQIEAQRGAIGEHAASGRVAIEAATTAMQGRMRGAADKSRDTFAAAYDTSMRDLGFGVERYVGEVAGRMTEAFKTLPARGENPIWTCANHRVRSALRGEFGDTRKVNKTVQELRGAHEIVLLDVHSSGQGKIEEVRKQSSSAARAAKRSGHGAVDAQETRSLEALRATEDSVRTQLEQSIAGASSRLDRVEADRNALLDQAMAQTHSAAKELSTSLSAARWSEARTLAQSLISTAGASSAGLMTSHRASAAEPALLAIQAFDLDTSQASAAGLAALGAWASGHTDVIASFGAENQSATASWRTDALDRLSTAEARADESVVATGADTGSSIQSLVDDSKASLSTSSKSAQGHLTNVVTTNSDKLSTLGLTFINGLDKTLGVSKLDNLQALANVEYNTLEPDFRKRASELYKGMFEAGMLNGTDEIAVFNALRGIGPYGAGALAYLYKDSTPRTDLYADLYSDLSASEHKIAKAYLSNDDTAGIRMELDYHQGYFSDDEKAIKDLLTSIDEKQRVALVNSDGWEDASKALYENLSDDKLDLRVVQSLVAGNKARAEALVLIDKIVDARWSDDTKALRAIMEGIPSGPARVEILAQFAVLQELAGRTGGLDALDFKEKELDPELLAEMNGAADNGATVVDDDLTERKLTVAEQRFGEWATQDEMTDDALYKEGDAGIGRHVLTDMTSLATDHTGRRDVMEGRSELDDNTTALIKNQAMYGSESLQGRAATVHYESVYGEDSEKAYKAMAKEHTDDDGVVTNSAFASKEDRDGKHAEWNKRFEEVYADQNGTSAASDINKGDFSDEERAVLNETRTGGQASADALLTHAKDGTGVLGMGTNEWATNAALKNAEAGDIKAYFKANPKARAELLSEYSGDEREAVLILLEGKVRTDRQRWNIAKIRHTYVRGTGTQDDLERNMFWDLLTDAGQMMDLNYQQMKDIIEEAGGEALAFDADGNLRTTGEPGSAEETEQKRAFAGAGESLEYAEEMYKASQDVITGLVAAVVGLVVTVLTAGAAGPVVAALLAGVASIATKVAMKGDRYGWEEMAKDAGILALEVATAGLAQKVTNAAKAAQASKDGIQIVDDAVLKTIELSKGVQTSVKAGEAFVSSTGTTLMSEETYNDGVWTGIGNAFKSGGVSAGNVYLGSLTDKLGDIVFDERIKNMKTNWTKDALSVGKTSVTSLAGGEAQALFKATVEGDGSFEDSQMNLVTSAGWSAVSKSMTASSDRESADAANRAKDNGRGNAYTNTRLDKEAADAKDKNTKNTNMTKILVGTAEKTTAAGG